MYRTYGDWITIQRSMMKILSTIVMVTAVGVAIGTSNVPRIKQGVGVVQGGFGRQQVNTAPVSYNRQPAPTSTSSLLRIFILIQLFSSLFTTTTTTTTPAVTTMPAVTTDEVTTEEMSTAASTTPMATLPDPFNSWYEYKGCRYFSPAAAQTWPLAKSTCPAFGTGVTTAQKNVRTVDDRGTLLKDGLGLTAVTLWIGLTDSDGSGSTGIPQWLNGDNYVTEPLASVIYSSGIDSSIALAIGNRYQNILFHSDASRTASRLVCEYCPP